MRRTVNRARVRYGMLLDINDLYVDISTIDRRILKRIRDDLWIVNLVVKDQACLVLYNSTQHLIKDFLEPDNYPEFEIGGQHADT